MRDLSTAFSKNHDVFVGTIKGKLPVPDKKNFCFNVERTFSVKVTENDYLALPQLDAKFKRKMKKADIDVIHCHSTANMAAFGLKLAKKKNIPFVITVHTKMKTALERRIKNKFVLNFLIKRLVKKLNKADIVCTVGESIERELRDYGYTGPVQIVRNGISLRPVFDKQTLAQELKQQYNLQDGVPVFCFVGLVVQYKNIDFILQVLDNIKKRGQDFKFFIVGDGPDSKYFKKRTQELGLQNNVVFTSRIADWRELSKYYAGSDLLLFPSIFDTDGLVKYEAGAYGTATCVLKNSGASERLVHNQNGFVFDNDVNSFANSLFGLLQNPDKIKQVGANMQNCGFPGWEDIGEQYVHCYQQAINKKKK